MRSLFAALIAILLFETGPASAAIRIINSQFEGDTLTVTGQAPPNQTVTLDGKYKTTADGGGRFEFRVQYKPRTCMSNITTGADSYSAIINGCLLSDAAAASKTAAEAVAGDR